MATNSTQPYQPSLGWRITSTATLGIIAAICRGAMFGLNKTEVHGLEDFTRVLDERKDVNTRKRGLITVSNHLSIIDDPFLWGALPLRYSTDTMNMRWSLASHDICFSNKPLSVFFSLGQVLPTHRSMHSPLGGLFQPTMREAVRLMSNPHRGLETPVEEVPAISEKLSSLAEITDPFSSSQLTYSTNGIDSFPAPASYTSRKYSWIHIFPEGRIHQHPDKFMRYFKWGIARLILEPDECPDIIPIWFEGTENIMHESRTFPRFIPRVGKQIGIWFGEKVAGDGESVFRDLRRRWQRLVEQDRLRRLNSTYVSNESELSDELKYGEEAVALRKECTLEARKLVLNLRKKRPLPDEDPKASLAETWIEEGDKKEGKMKDGSWIKDT